MAKNGINKCIILGRLGSDPEVIYMPNGGLSRQENTFGTIINL